MFINKFLKLCTFSLASLSLTLCVMQGTTFASPECSATLSGNVITVTADTVSNIDILLFDISNASAIQTAAGAYPTISNWWFNEGNDNGGSFSTSYTIDYMKQTYPVGMGIGTTASIDLSGFIGVTPNNITVRGGHFVSGSVLDTTAYTCGTIAWYQPTPPPASTSTSIFPTNAAVTVVSGITNTVVDSAKLPVLIFGFITGLYLILRLLGNATSFGGGSLGNTASNFRNRNKNPEDY